jgi:hypothetical protein
MIEGMTVRTTITMDDRLYALVREAAGGNVSEWIARAARSRLLAEDARAMAEWDRMHPEGRAAWHTDVEAEREARWASEEAERKRHGDAP